jgi:hypothetical protein
MRATMFGLATALSLLAHAATASAQDRIDTYLNPSVPGIEMQPGVTVTSRLRPEYEFPGLRLGGFIADPLLTENVGYDTNVTATKPAHGSSLAETIAVVPIISDWGSDSLGGNISVDNSTYLDQPRQSFTNWTASIGGSKDFGLDTLSLAYAHLNLYQTPSSLDTPQLDSPIAYRVDTVRVNYKAQFGQTTITPGIDVSTYNFDNGTVQGVPFIQSFRDRVVVTPTIIGNYEVAPLRTIVAVVRYADAQYTEPQQGQPSRNYNDAAVLGGVNYDTGGLIRFRFLVGFETRHFQSTAYETISAPIIEASAVWTPTGLTTVTGSIARYIADSSTEETVGYTETAVKLAVDHEYLPNVLLNANTVLYSDTYSQNEGQQSSYSFGLGGTWLLNHNMRLGATYQYTARISPNSAVNNTATFSNGILGSSYSDNRFLLQFKIGL